MEIRNPKAEPDGTIPEHEQQMLRELGRWLKVNGEADHGTRPWKIFGEGATAVVAGSLSDPNRQRGIQRHSVGTMPELAGRFARSRRWQNSQQFCQF